MRGTRGPDGDLILNSYELLYILEFLPEESAFKTATRGGQWPLMTRMAAEAVNEQYRLRSSFHAANSTPEADARFDPEPFFFIDPTLRELHEEVAKQEAQAAADFNAEIGFS